MLAVAALYFVASQAKLPSYEQFLKNVHSEYTKLKGYRESWTVRNSDAKPDEGPMRLVRTIDGDRARMQVFDGATLVIDTLADGKSTTMVAHAAKIYAQTEKKKSIKEEPFKMPSTDNMDDNSFSLVMDQVYSPILLFKPAPKVQSLQSIVVDGKPARLLELTVKRKDGSEPGGVKVWLLPDRWLITRVEMTGTRDGKGETTTLDAKIEENVTFGPADFVIDPKSYAGYNKVDFGG